MDLTYASAPGRPRTRLIAVALTVAAITVVGAVIAVAAGRPPLLPAPFGPAANGALYYVADGDVLRLDPATGASTSVITDVAAEATVLPSLDGSRIAIIRTSGSTRTISIASADGRDHRLLPGTYRGELEVEWSPTRGELAIASDASGLGRIWILPADGSEPSALELGMDARHIRYLPDGRLLYKGTRETPAGQTFALYLLDPVTGSVDALTAGSTNLMDIIAARPSPDGTKVVYHRWREPDEKGRIRVIDIESREDTALPVGDPDGVFTDLNPVVSPDGNQLFFTRYTAAGNELVIVPSTGGTPVPIGEYTPSFDAPEAAWSPDGRSIIARYHNGNVWLLDATGTGDDRRLDLDTPGLPAWQRVGG